MNNFHDFSIFGIRLSQGGCNLTISMRDPQDVSACELMIENVAQLFIDGFTLQNVVLDIKVFRERVPSFEYGRACELLGLDPREFSVPPTQVMLFVEASVGAELACLIDGELTMRVTPLAEV